VNLIGEHTDHQDGFVLPMAVDLATWIASVPREDRRVELTSLAISETRAFDLDDVSPERRSGGWIDYAAGVAWSLREAGMPLRGARGVIESDVPLGAGLSSSAALEVAVALTLLEEPGSLEPARLAELCRRAEADFVGLPCGMMDQLASVAGVEGHALLIDCRSREVRPITLPEDLAIVVLDSAVRRRLGETEYAERRRECEEAARRLGAGSLRDVTEEDLEWSGSSLPPTLRARAEHVVTENARVLAAADALEGGDLERLGNLVSASHASLRDRFEVSTPDLDRLVATAEGVDGVFGARLVGGGFGGSVLVLCRQSGVAELQRAVEADGDERQTGRQGVYVLRAVNGAETVEI
jgi:galactokinase